MTGLRLIKRKERLDFQDMAICRLEIFEMCMASRFRTPIDHFYALQFWWCFSACCLACRLISLNIEISLSTQNLVWVVQVSIFSPPIFFFPLKFLAQHSWCIVSWLLLPGSPCRAWCQRGKFVHWNSWRNLFLWNYQASPW